jgi:redox-sensing transcriptional repressor
MERISASTIRRLSGYLRVLDDLVQQGADIASSKELAERTGVSSAQLRKDLSLFGTFGRRGYGYEVESLRAEIRGILGVSRRWRVAIVGAGNVGTALFAYKEFPERGFDVAAVFDSSRERVGQRLGDLVIEPMDRLGEICRERAIEIGVIAVPARAAQEAADALVRAGVRALLNFAPRKLAVPRGVTLRDVNLAVELESLAFALRAGAGAR